MRLSNGDALEYLEDMDTGSVGAVITDPPYGTNQHGWDDSVSPKVFAECARVSKGYSVFFYSNTRLWHILGVFHELGIDTWVAAWSKTNAIGFERKFAPLWVPIVVAYKKGSPFFGQDVFSYPIVPHKKQIHPTMKPVPLVEKLIMQTTEPGDLVLDPFMGSGTTGIACVRTGRQFWGIEINPEYYDAACDRIEKTQRPLFIYEKITNDNKQKQEE